MKEKTESPIIFFLLRMILFMIFIFGIMIPSKVFAIMNQPIISFEEDLEYTGDQQVFADIQGEGVPLDLEKIMITYEGVEGDGRSYQNTEQAPRNVGFYTVIVSYSGDENYQKIERNQQVRITPRPLKNDEFFNPSPIGKMYDGSTDSELVMIEDLNHRQILESDKKAVLIGFQSSRYLFKDVNGPNQLILSGISLAGEKSYNYSLEQRSIEENDRINDGLKNKISVSDILIDASIEKKPIGIYLTSKNKVYDGTTDLTTYGFAINQSDLIKGEQIEILVDSNFSPWYGLENSKRKDIGSYRVYAQEGFSISGLNGTNGDNYRPANLPIYSHITYEITPAQIIITPAYRYKHEGEEDPLLTYSVWQVTSRDELLDGLFIDDTLDGSLRREPGEVPGLYDINQGDLNNANYIILFENGENKFEILGKETKVATIEGDDYLSKDSARGRWDQIITPETLFGGGLIVLIILVVGVFYVRNKMTNFD